MLVVVEWKKELGFPLDRNTPHRPSMHSGKVVGLPSLPFHPDSVTKTGVSVSVLPWRTLN